MDAKAKAIWIDVDNSPHVPLFAPIIRHYRDRGIEVVLTARDHAQTIELLDLAGFAGTYTVVGRHYGKARLSKVQGLIVRAFELRSHIKRITSSDTRVAVALSHGSRSMVLAARWMGLPTVTMYDYEFTETRIFNRFSTRVLVPEQIPDSVLDGIGLSPAKRVKYPGIKEELYVRNFVPDPGFRERLLSKERGLANMADRMLVVLRPPAGTANYHSEQSDVLLEVVLSYLLGDTSVVIAIVPRTVEQGKEIEDIIHTSYCGATNYIILNRAVHGLDLAFAADLVISGGGTMNREAALLGVPVYSIFAGKQGSLDKVMEAEKLITFIRDEEDVEKIALKPRHRDPQFTNPLTDRVERFVIEQIDSFLV